MDPEIGFGILFMGTVITVGGNYLSPDSGQIYLRFCLPDLIFVIIGLSELFTEHAALTIIPVLYGNIKIKDLFIV